MKFLLMLCLCFSAFAQNKYQKDQELSFEEYRDKVYELETLTNETLEGFKAVLSAGQALESRFKNNEEIDRDELFKIEDKLDLLYANVDEIELAKGQIELHYFRYLSKVIKAEEEDLKNLKRANDEFLAAARERQRKREEAEANRSYWEPLMFWKWFDEEEEEVVQEKKIYHVSDYKKDSNKRVGHRNDFRQTYRLIEKNIDEIYKHVEADYGATLMYFHGKL